MIEFRKVNRDNFDEVIRMNVLKEQQNYLLDRCFYLALAYAKEEYHPYTIYYKEEMVGFFMIHKNEAEKAHILDTFFIRSSKQQQGYGSWSMKKIIQMLKEDLSTHTLKLEVTKDNQPFKKLLMKLSFKEMNSPKQEISLYRLDY